MSNAQDIPPTTLAPSATAGSVNVADETAGRSTPVRMSAPEPSPGDEAPAGTIGAGEDTCPRCSGSGKVDGDRACPDCDGTGIIIQGIGGG